MERTSTDRRIDDLRADMGHRFGDFKADVDCRFVEVNLRVDRVELQVAELRAETNAGFAQLNARFDGLYKIMLGGGAAIFVAVLGILAKLV